MNKIQLKDVTFIIPVKIDSYDREQNFKFVINYLTKNFNTNIIIAETSNDDNLILKSKYGEIIESNNIQIIEKRHEKVFHRTRYLNEMLNMVKTSVTVNYDIDVFIPINSYLEAYNLIVNDGYDLVYPYSRGWFQYMVPQDYRDEIMRDNNKDININRMTRYTSEFGHLQFFNTESYKKGYGENEGFIAYGPEDKERYYRFENLGFKICHMSHKKYVFHLEHHRGSDSGHHKNFESNENLWLDIKKVPLASLRDYYKDLNYVKERFL